jgi:dTDP-4-amino-4,6-dideoxygalactose transaminase/CelD/BcsL family acetyltransferase involved in cellulose biosynthesis
MTAPRHRIWPPLPVDVYARRPRDPLPFPLEEPNCVLFANARHGLWRGVTAIGLQRGDEVLMPAYHHGSEVEALLQAGLECRFYEASETLEPDPGELESLLTPRTRALYLIHYFGFPQDCPRWRAWSDERGLLLIEDVAQGWLATHQGRPLGSFGDLAIFCLYKSVGLPDGGAVVATAVTPGPEPAPRLAAAATANLHRAWLTSRSERFAALTSPLATVSGSDGRRPTQPTAESAIFGLEHEGVPPSSATRFLLPRLADPEVAARRRANYELLQAEFADRVPPPFETLPAGASPLVFPLETDAVDELRERLVGAGIDGAPFWTPLHPALPGERFPGALAWRRRFVALPVHQELRPGDIERIVKAVDPKTPRRPSLRLERLSGVDDAREEWNELAQRSRNIFATWEWASTWWRHFGGGRPLIATACRQGSELVALLPLYLSAERPLRVVRFLGHGPGDQLGPVCAPEDNARAAKALSRVLAEAPWRWDVFLGDELSAADGWSALLGASVEGRGASPVLSFGDGGWEGLLASLSPRLRREIRYDSRKLAREHDVHFRLADDPDRLDADFDTLFALHSTRWSNSAFATRHQAFHRDFGRAALERGWLRLWFLEVGGRPVAAWYGFRFAGVQSHYQGGRDPAWNRSSVGLVLLAHSIREAIEDGVTEYRFLRGAEGYKYRFAKHDPGLESIALARGLKGRTALRAQRMARAARATGRRVADARLRRNGAT